MSSPGIGAVRIARGAREGAPKAKQVVDRFHLLKNRYDHTAALIGPWEPRSELIARDHAEEDPESGETPETAVSSRKQVRWAVVYRLWDQGVSLTAIAEQLYCDPKTVCKDIGAAQPSPFKPPRRRSDRSENQLLAELWRGPGIMGIGQKTGLYQIGCLGVALALRQRRGHVQRGRRPATPSDARTEGAGPSRPKKPSTGHQWAYCLGTTRPNLPRRATNISKDLLYRKSWTLTPSVPHPPHCREGLERLVPCAESQWNSGLRRLSPTLAPRLGRRRGEPHCRMESRPGRRIKPSNQAAQTDDVWPGRIAATPEPNPTPLKASGRTHGTVRYGLSHNDTFR